MRLYVDVHGDESKGFGPEKFWQLVNEVSAAIFALEGEDWTVIEVGLQTNRREYRREKPKGSRHLRVAETG